ncbi:MAG: sigma-70 family RNA polymerase sigma factor, partial [Chloroflexota bacterium]
PDVIERARGGDRSAFGELYDAHCDAVYRYILYRVREPSDAEDLTSEVFTRAFANIHRYRWQGKSFLAWLYTIARNAVTDRRRRQRPTVDLDDAYGLAADGPTAHDRAVTEYRCGGEGGERDLHPHRIGVAGHDREERRAGRRPQEPEGPRHAAV